MIRGVCALGLVCLCFGASSGGVKAQQYNVLYFVADDLRPEIAKGYDQKAMHTPNIDKMAAGGLVFEKAYCQQAVCGAR